MLMWVGPEGREAKMCQERSRVLGELLLYCRLCVLYVINADERNTMALVCPRQSDFPDLRKGFLYVARAVLELDGAGKQEAQLSTLLLGSPTSIVMRAVAAGLSCSLAH